MANDDQAAFISLVGLGLVLLYFAAACAWVRWPRRATETGPIADPPRDLSPAEMRLIVAKQVDARGLAAVLVSLEAKAYVQIAQHEAEFTVSRTGADKSRLTREERAVAASLFADKDTVTLSPDGPPTAAHARRALAMALLPARRMYLARHTGLVVLGTLLSLSVCLAAFSQLFPGDAATGIVVGLCFAFFAAFFALVSCRHRLRSRRHHRVPHLVFGRDVCQLQPFGFRCLPPARQRHAKNDQTRGFGAQGARSAQTRLWKLMAHDATMACDRRDRQIEMTSVSCDSAARRTIPMRCTRLLHLSRSPRRPRR